MKTILEVFYLRIVGANVRYQRKETNLSRKGGDPDRMIWSLIQEKRRDSAGEAEDQEFLIHSTSWRHEKPDKVVLTYIAYSDELKFEKGKAHNLSLKKLRTLTKQSRPPRSQAELEKKVVSHAMRHIAFLIKTDDQNEFKSALSPRTIAIFKKIWVSLAGRVF
ncbi:MAG: hypothetical protein EHM33_00580 [Chloroflexi bacterium]|nr:MAG: hypothetical protein EHM33_00580 [Chloroflexota bacterium]